jgi:short-subunit dehydrogenase
MPQGEQIAIITGSSSGIGYETSLMLARNGFHTYATMRNIEGRGEGGSNQITDIAKNENLPLEVIQLDVNSDKSVTEAINRIADEKDRIDVVVNNAGYDLTGAIEEISLDQMRAQFETNFFGAVKVMKSIIPKMRKQRSGKIVNITSMGGRIAIPFHSIYHGTKFALEGLSESIQYELEPFGIKIILIEPGAVGSNFWKNMKTATKPTESESTDSPYSQMKTKISESLNQAVQNAMHPSEVAKAILEAISSDNPDFRYPVGKDANMTIEARKNMSDAGFQDLLRKQFNLQNDS